MLNPCGASFVDDVLQNGPIDDGQHFLRHRLRRGKKPRSEPGNREHGLTNGLNLRIHAKLRGAKYLLNTLLVTVSVYPMRSDRTPRGKRGMLSIGAAWPSSDTLTGGQAADVRTELGSLLQL
jgi:hypothetical protein